MRHIKQTIPQSGIFLDRDGVINNVILKEGKPFSPKLFKEFKLLPHIKNALRAFKAMGCIVLIVTNQPEISRGTITRVELNKMHSYIKKRLPVDEIIVCPHDDSDHCDCRKPKSGMLIQALKRWNIDFKRSFLIGDTWKDIEAGKAVGCKTILIDKTYNRRVENSYRVKDITEAVRTIRSWVKKFQKESEDNQ